MEILERAGVDVVEVGAANLLAVGKQTGVAIVLRDAPALLAELGRRSDDHDLVEPLLRPHLVEQRHLGDTDARRVVESGELLPPGEVLARDDRVEQAFEPRELLAIAEDRLRDPATVRAAVLTEHPLSEARDDRVAHLVVGREQVVDDLVARDGRGTVRAECLEGGGLAGADSPRDRDRDRAARH